MLGPARPSCHRGGLLAYVRNGTPFGFIRGKLATFCNRAIVSYLSDDHLSLGPPPSAYTRRDFSACGASRLQSPVEGICLTASTPIRPCITAGSTTANAHRGCPACNASRTTRGAPLVPCASWRLMSFAGRCESCSIHAYSIVPNRLSVPQAPRRLAKRTANGPLGRLRLPCGNPNCAIGSQTALAAMTRCPCSASPEPQC